MFDPLLRGIAVGAFCVTGLGVWRSELGRDSRVATLLACFSAAAWTLTESDTTRSGLGQVFPLLLLAFPVAGLFWLFVATVIEDRPLAPLAFAPAAAFVVMGSAMTVASAEVSDRLGVAFNVLAVLLCLHAALMVLRGWQGDLVASRRSLRAAILGFAAVFAAVQGGTGVLRLLDPAGPWVEFSIRRLDGAVIVALLGVAMGALFLHGRAPLFATARPRDDGADPRADAAERLLLAGLAATMDGGAWRNEGLTIGRLARELATPEHQLRRLINGRLGHRNFADFLNGYRIKAAQGRLADPAQARTTIAAIAFDVGYGSLSPFNRAFRATTGSTPTLWRRDALQAAANSAEAD
ncbi:AraC family transcriptional regulator [Phenylobacterium sp.]|uniref:helix-turn-helix domain-containing protein n=1 Tax=Phenylobacterium sp. TaxID=1871053 RepID=UPI0025DA76E8|nr:AraC family transcriptional regulator [Phenylobacterium sp.]